MPVPFKYVRSRQSVKDYKESVDHNLRAETYEEKTLFLALLFILLKAGKILMSKQNWLGAGLLGDLSGLQFCMCAVWGGLFCEFLFFEGWRYFAFQVCFFFYSFFLVLFLFLSYGTNCQNKLNKLPRPDGIHPGALKELKDEITELPGTARSLSLHQYLRNTTKVKSIFNK